jgi:L-ribulose-5-phosphate 4-epimerase
MTDSLVALRASVLEANVEIARRGLAPFTFGNVSGIDRARGLVVIKPSGVAYESLTAESLVVTDLTGTVVEGMLRPSSDLQTHLVLYRAFESSGGLLPKQSHFATVWAQSCREIPCLGTTHADYFHGSIPITSQLTRDEVDGDYEANTGHAIRRRFVGMDALRMRAVLVAGHASFCWGRDVDDALEAASLLEEVARMAYHTVVLNAAAEPISESLLDKHFFRKHGPAAYYGQSRDASS